MSFITEWVTNIILFVLLATVVDMLLPNSSFQKYAKMVAGLLLITVILTPVFKLVNHDFEDVVAQATFKNSDEKNIKNSMELQKKEIQASLDEYTLNKMAVQMKEDANKELVNQYGIEIETLSITVDKGSEKSFPENLEKLVISLKPGDGEQNENAVEAVKTVDINTQNPDSPKSDQLQVDTDSITSFLANKWDVKDENIDIVTEGGESETNG
ncbi:stage III sporulation protein AF [Niallia nealsonii]|uniref:Stage III sporulation protein AF n=1 Tax=Niallia nealsonii TaxID=115979 RepID=A0A2N0Z873_9BACI|nr:stage III sporulation protein AF [Niallia nealsonii]PKG25684.1 stage III sporulation protein AF [Niallia nealsonii]